MKVQLIDFIAFFNDKDKEFNKGLGTGATAIITDKQMVTRINETEIDEKTGSLVPGLGRHEQEKGLILSDIFALHKGLFQNREQHYRALQSMTDMEKNVLEDVIEIRYNNTSGGNTIMIKILDNGISINQYKALEYLIKYLESINSSLSKPINIWIGNKSESIAIEDNYEERILSYLKKIINHNFSQSIEDVNIIAENIHNKLR